MKYQRFIPLVLPVAIYTLSQIAFFEPPFFYSFLSLGVLLIILSAKALSFKEGHDWLPLALAPLLLFLSGSFYVAVIVNFWLIQVILLFIFWFIFSYFKNLYYYFKIYSTSDAVDLSIAKLDNLFIAGSFLAVFFSAAACFMFPAFLSWSNVHTLVTLCLVMLLLFWQYRFLTINKENFPWLMMSVLILVLVEAIWAVSLLPLNFNILALFVAIFYYFALTVLRLKLRGSLFRRAWQLPFILSLVIVLGLLVTARWL